MSGLVVEALLLSRRNELSSALDSHLPSSSSSEEVVKANNLSVSMVTPSTISITSAFSGSEVLSSDEKVILLLSPNLEGEQEPYLSLLSTLRCYLLSVEYLPLVR